MNTGNNYIISRVQVVTFTNVTYVWKIVFTCELLYNELNTPHPWYNKYKLNIIKLSRMIHFHSVWHCSEPQLFVCTLFGIYQIIFCWCMSGIRMCYPLVSFSLVFRHFDLAGDLGDLSVEDLHNIRIVWLHVINIAYVVYRNNSDTNIQCMHFKHRG